MAKRRTWFLGIGCLALLAIVAVTALAVSTALMGPRLPSRVVLGITLAGPIPEVGTDDPLEDLLGDGPMSLRELRNALVQAADDARVVGVRLRIDSFGGGLATAQEIRSLLARVNAAGKWTAAYMDTAGEAGAGNLEYYVAAACDEVSLNPLGDINLIGLSVRVPFIRGSLDKLGVQPEFPGHGDYKTARFMYTERELTPAHQEMLEWLLDSAMGQLVDGIAASRAMEPAAIRNLIDRAPLLGKEAAEVGLVDNIESWGDFTQRLVAQEEQPFSVVGPSTYLHRSRHQPRGPKIAVVTAVGTILRGKSYHQLNPIYGNEVMGSQTIADALRKARETSGVKAVVFRVDSGGGSAVASEVIRQEMVRTAAEIPVVVSMGNAAASGGYWIACGAQRIVANPGTMTGSIGVFTGHLNMDDFWSEKLGVTFGRVDRGANADFYGGLDDWSDSQRAVAQRMIDRIYDAFVERVAEARDLTTADVDAMGQGRVFTGEQGFQRSLVDLVGGFDEALEEARKLAGLEPAAPVTLVELPKPKPLWMQLLDQEPDELASLRASSEALNRWWQTGIAETPGVVWMPPLTLR